ncbi:hypothetical protein BEP19_12110 [Ammoniphilus oxalaticus]|uniref:Uncharacterized protein n=1 Tax=Ammoniphilus oxalaticus TaxID=66863 RepID=A0A419SGR6_9BACL|nr:hypothetical protein [Ammoniphilus oxalaticus]RKD22968.1 hypothetical protein BEP19_12110 [Ammoniphilus oxalaticus]
MNNFIDNQMFHSPSFPSIKKRVFGQVESFDVYPLLTKPIIFVDPETGAQVREPGSCLHVLFSHNQS